MLEPKEKAIELFNKFKLAPIGPIYFMHPQHSKKCAIIAVDEVLNICAEAMDDYWIEVKEYLELL
jgi:hypothetical protein